jgi:hypothetical protein
VGAHDEGPKPDGQQVGENMLNRVGVERDDASWSRPLMVDLVEVLVELRVVKEPTHKEDSTLKNSVTDSRTTNYK